MNRKEETLSDKIENPINRLEFTKEYLKKRTVIYDENNQWIKVEDVKDFIKKLKDISTGYDLEWEVHRKCFLAEIDKLAGDKLK